VLNKHLREPFNITGKKKKEHHSLKGPYFAYL
jgi:hypothetical protein